MRKMSEIRCIWILALLVVLTVFLVAPDDAKAAKKFRLKWGHYLAAGPFLEVEQNFAKKIQERTNGRVRIDMIYAGGLGKGGELLTLAGRGAIDMGTDAPGYYADELPFWKAFQIPFVFGSPHQAMEVLAKSYKEFPIYKQEMDRLNVHWLFQQPLGVYYLTGPSPDCDTVAKLKGKKIRSFGADIPKAHRAVGAVPVTVLPVEVYEALQRGTIDYSFLNPGNIQQYRLYEPGKYSCGPIMAITGHNIVIGKPTWKKLPKDIREIFDDQAKKSHQEYLDWLSKFEAQAMKNIEAQGGVFKKFPPGELAKWKAATPDLLAAWVKEMEKKGYGDSARRVAKRWRELTAD
jgi:TRAP-type C4-dicarboxylate transport system substrate-binding protein